MKMKYEVPAIEVLDLKETAICAECDKGNTFNGVRGKNGCGGYSILGKMTWTTPMACDCGGGGPIS